MDVYIPASNIFLYQYPVDIILSCNGSVQLLLQNVSVQLNEKQTAY